MIVRVVVTGPPFAYQPIKAPRTLFIHSCDHLLPRFVIALSPGNPPAVRIRTLKSVQFSPATVQKLTSWVLAGQFRTHTRQHTGFAGFG